MNTGNVTNMNSKYTTFFRFLFEENYQIYINKTKMKTANYKSSFVTGFFGLEDLRICVASFIWGVGATISGLVLQLGSGGRIG